MKTIALLSGGKDSILSVLIAMRYGHVPAVIANMAPGAYNDAELERHGQGTSTNEVDSYMFQTVGHEVMDCIAECLQLPLRRSRVRRGQAKDQSLAYTENPPEDDEVEEMYRLLKTVKEEFPEVQGVTTGAILSNYQRNRVEQVCARLELVSLAYLWQRRANEVLDMATTLGVRAVLVKVASVGLNPRRLLGQTLEAARPTLQRMEDLYGSHLAGEGGEFETTVLDCPLFKEHAIVVTHMDIVMVDENEYAPSGHSVLTVTLEPKVEAKKLEDARILAKLMDLGDARFHFPSDTMASFPDFGKLSLPACGVDTENVTFVDTVFAAFADSLQAWESVFTTKRFACETAVSVDDAFAALGEWLAQNDLVALAYYVVCTESAESAVGAAYNATAPMVNPPTVSWVIRNDGIALLLQVLATRKEEEHTPDVIHAQSLSCWAAGVPGARWSQAFRYSNSAALNASRTRVTLRSCGGVQGTDPTTGFFASLLPRQPLPPHTSENDRAFIYQFAFAYANAAAYLDTLGVSLAELPNSDAPVVVCAVTCSSHAALVPPLWRWCVARTDEGAPSAQPCVLVVDALRNKALVEVNVLHFVREACSDDDESLPEQGG